MQLSNIFINDFILIALIGAALFFDLTRYKIPNFLTFPAIVWGLISYTAIDGLNGLWFSSAGLLLGLAIFFIPFAMGGFGGGDVKLMGAIGALQGWQFVLMAGVLTALIGGVISIVYLIATRRLLRVLKKIAGFALAPFFSFLFYITNSELFNRISIFFASEKPREANNGRLPYGIAIALGAIAFLLYEKFSISDVYYSYLVWL